MEKENKATIQDQQFKVDLIMRDVNLETAADAVSGYLPGSVVGETKGGIKTVTDHLERIWAISWFEEEGQGERVVVSTPKLAYVDIDELLYLVGELKECGAKGAEGCGMRFYAYMENQSDLAVQNLRNIVTSKSILLGKAILQPFEVKPERMQPDDEGFVELVPCEMAADFNLAEMKACIQLGCAITAQAIGQNRASAEVLHPENEKYAFRCWMIRLGLKGKDCKPMRMRFLKRLEGDASYKGGRKMAMQEV